MSSLSPIFSLVLATTSDTVNVVTQLSNNFSALDSILSQAHTGTGQLKGGLTIATPTLVTPSVSGSLTIGTYSYPLTIGSTGHTLVASGGNVVFKPAALKAWVSFSASATSAVLASYSVSGVVRNATGDFTITFSPAFANTLYAVSFGVQNATARIPLVITRAASTCNINCLSLAGTTADATAIDMMFIGT